MALSGTFITSYWDGNKPNVQKAALKLDLISESLSGTLTVTAAYMKDNETSWTDINSTDAIFNTSPAETISFNSGVTFRRIRLRFTLASTATTTTPVIKAFTLHVSWRPSRLKRWTMVAAIADDVRSLQGVKHILPAGIMLSQLSTLKDAVWPITMEDIDAVSQTCHIIEMREGQFKVRSELSGQPVKYSRGVELVLMEAKTT